MIRISSLAGAAALVLAAASAQAEIAISDAYARSAMPNAMTGAIFMRIENSGSADDRLIDARSDAAAKVELHTHEEDANGVMRMIEVEEGFAIPAGGAHLLERGADHVMLIGLAEPLVQGETVALTLVFEEAGEKSFDIEVDLERQPSHGMTGHDHSGHGDAVSN